MTRDRMATAARSVDRRLIVVAALLLLAAIATVFVISQTSGPRQVQVINEQTEAREIRPFTTSLDPRFDPLPIEEEGH
jgi:hypothetical protein